MVGGTGSDTIVGSSGNDNLVGFNVLEDTLTDASGEPTYRNDVVTVSPPVRR